MKEAKDGQFMICPCFVGVKDILINYVSHIIMNVLIVNEIIK